MSQKQEVSEYPHTDSIPREGVFRFYTEEGIVYLTTNRVGIVNSGLLKNHSHGYNKAKAECYVGRNIISISKKLEDQKQRIQFAKHSSN